MYKKIVKDFKLNPRDVHTVPLVKKTCKWFYVSVDREKLYVESARDHTPKCTVKRRILLEKECNEILSIYHRRTRGEKVSVEAQECTLSQVYWYGIFADLNL